MFGCMLFNEMENNQNHLTIPIILIILEVDKIGSYYGYKINRGTT